MTIFIETYAIFLSTFREQYWRNDKTHINNTHSLHKWFVRHCKWNHLFSACLVIDVRKKSRDVATNESYLDGWVIFAWNWFILRTGTNLIREKKTWEKRIWHRYYRWSNQKTEKISFENINIYWISSLYFYKWSL